MFTARCLRYGVYMEPRVAHRLVAEAKAEGRLVPEPCEVCRDPLTVAHHDDYEKPLAVRWFCAKHHRAWHREHDAAGFEGSRVVSVRLPRELWVQLEGMAEDALEKPSVLLRRIVGHWFAEGWAKWPEDVPPLVEPSPGQVRSEGQECRHPGQMHCRICRTGRWVV